MTQSTSTYPETISPAVHEPLPADVYVGFDLETTGVDPFHDAPVSSGFVKRLSTDLTTSLGRWHGYVNPGISIPEEATAVHGITDDMVRNAHDLAYATDVIANRLASVWRMGGVVVGMNVDYDLTMIESLCTRLGLVPLSQRCGIGPVLDILVIDRHFDKWRRGGRKLVDLCATYEVVIEDAHDACADAAASIEVLGAMLRKFPALAELVSNKEGINEHLRSWYLTWLTDFSEYLVTKGEDPVSPRRFAWPIQS